MGFGMYLLAGCTALLVLGLLLAHDHPMWPKLKMRHPSRDRSK
jgi:hypothetical protein